VFGQLVLGAIMRHIGAGLAVPDFPRMYGRWIPPAEVLEQAPVAVHLAHRAGALVVLRLRPPPGLRASRDGDRRLARPAQIALGWCSSQIGLGALTVLTGRPSFPTTAHVATGAAILGLCWFTTLRTRGISAWPRPRPPSPRWATRRSRERLRSVVVARRAARADYSS
jgi:cytochrome c oxidase assembly protein subunit 15